MSGSIAVHPTLVSTLWPTRREASFLRLTLLAIAGSLLLTLSAKIQVPFWPVPMTMQTLVVLVIGMAFGPRLGVATVGLYLAEGAFGLPVFAGTPAKGIGLAYMVGPTGGYLAGFVAATLVVGWLAERGWDRGILTTLAAMVLGTAAIYAFGLAWLAYLLDGGRAVAYGLLPFLPAAALKIALATALLPACWKLIEKRQGRR